MKIMLKLLIIASLLISCGKIKLQLNDSTQTVNVNLNLPKITKQWAELMCVAKNQSATNEDLDSCLAALEKEYQIVDTINNGE